MSIKQTKQFSNLNKPLKCKCGRKPSLVFFSPSDQGALCIYDCECGITHKITYVKWKVNMIFNSIIMHQRNCQESINNVKQNRIKQLERLLVKKEIIIKKREAIIKCLNADIEGLCKYEA